MTMTKPNQNPTSNETEGENSTTNSALCSVLPSAKLRESAPPIVRGKRRLPHPPAWYHRQRAVSADGAEPGLNDARSKLRTELLFGERPQNGSGEAMSRSHAEVLLIEDDPEVIRAVTALCQTELSLQIVAESDGARGLELALSGDYSLIVCDANLPSKHGFDICREIRAKKPRQAIMFLTGRSDELDKVLGLELGADDYVTKPFSGRELAARIKALLRRIDRSDQLAVEQPTINIAHLTIDTVGRRVWKNKEAVQLTLVEYELLVLLASHPGETFSRADLMQMVLGYENQTHDDALTVHFSRLRSKVELEPNRPQLLRTVRGVGYRFAAPDEMEG